MRVTAEIHYQADPASVFAMLLEKSFQDRKLAETGAISWEVEVALHSDGATITSRRLLPTEGMPDAFRGIVGQQITIIQTETWGAAGRDGARTGALDVEVSGVPVRMRASLSLSTAAADAAASHLGWRTTELLDGELKARVPLIGGKIERSAEPAVRTAIDAEERIGRAWLAER